MLHCTTFRGVRIVSFGRDSLGNREEEGGGISCPPLGQNNFNKKHLKNVGPIRHCDPPHSPGVATVARRQRIDVHNNNDESTTTTTTRDRGDLEWAQ